MPRSYSFDHYTADKPDQSKRAHVGDRRRFTVSRAQLEPKAGLHYGKRYAETQEHYQAHRKASKRKKPTERAAVAPFRPLGEAVELGRERVRAVVDAGRDLAAAGIGLVRLPFEWVSLFARVLGRRAAHDRLVQHP